MLLRGAARAWRGRAPGLLEIGGAGRIMDTRHQRHLTRTGSDGGCAFPGRLAERRAVGRRPRPGLRPCRADDRPARRGGDRRLRPHPAQGPRHPVDDRPHPGGGAPPGRPVPAAARRARVAGHLDHLPRGGARARRCGHRHRPRRPQRVGRAGDGRGGRAGTAAGAAGPAAGGPHLPGRVRADRGRRADRRADGPGGAGRQRARGRAGRDRGRGGHQPARRQGDPACRDGQGPESAPAGGAPGPRRRRHPPRDRRGRPGGAADGRRVGRPADLVRAARRARPVPAPGDVPPQQIAPPDPAGHGPGVTNG